VVDGGRSATKQSNDATANELGRFLILAAVALLVIGGTCCVGEEA
jgi:hypothetical protein